METPVEYNAGKKEENQLRIAIYETPENIIEGGYGDFYNTLDRKTAIEKMAKALAFVQAKTFVDKEQWEIVMRGCEGPNAPTKKQAIDAWNKRS